MTPELFALAPNLHLTGDGAAWIPSRSTVVIADLHLGYSRAARRRGGYLPAIDDPADVAERVLSVCRPLGAEHVVIAGDLRHSTRDVDQLELDDVAAFRDALTGSGALESVTLVAGNHDHGDDTAVGELVVDDITIVHAPPAALPARWAICGHLHPSTTLRDETGAGIRVPCALVAPHMVILPAFSEWSGGTSASRLVRSLPLAKWRRIAIAGGRAFEI